ncbi:alanine dehydrogenase [Candidatus Aerophobetes bacterium]|nr:alanine dehydrogenase [Candidatus Aerophobetes bacterium]
MIIGIPKEIKNGENRVAIAPSGVKSLKSVGHSILIQRGAGLNSSILDEDYKKEGAKIVDSAKEVYDKADLILKVKEPLPVEYKLLREDQIIFTFFHFAANKSLTEAAVESGCTAIAYETVELENGELPLLTPMSEIAGKMASQEGAKYLEKPMGGRGILLGGVPGVAPAEVLILGAGVVGTNAAKVASGLGAKVSLLDINLKRLRYLDDIMPKNVTLLISNFHQISLKLREADLVIGAVLVKGARAPIIITKDMLKIMKPGSVIVDVSIDQGGCIQTSHPTSYDNPVYEVEGVIHYCVTNIPAGVPVTSTYALTNVTLPYVLEIANKGFADAVKENPALAKGVNIYRGKITHPRVAESFGMSYSPLKI